MKLRALDQGEDQREPGERLSERTAKHVNCTIIIINGERC